MDEIRLRIPAMAVSGSLMKTDANTLDSSRSGSSRGDWIACHECDLVHTRIQVSPGNTALCARCGAVLFRRVANSIDKAIAFNLSAFLLLIMSNCFTFLTLEIQGRFVENYFITGALMLYRTGMGEVGLLVLLTSIVFPFLTVTGMLYILIPLKFGYRPRQMTRVYALVCALRPWSLVSVFMLGVLVSMVKLLELANIIPGISMAAFIGLMVMLAVAHVSLDPSAIWQKTRQGNQQESPGVPGEAGEDKYPATDRDSGQEGRLRWRTAAQLGLVSCHTCGRLVEKDHQRCTGCGSRLHHRKKGSIQRTWALLVSAALLFIPANLYPAMTVHQLGQKGISSTIMGGVIHLIQDGTLGLAMIIFFASIMVPALKLIILSCLLVSVQKGMAWRPRDRTLLFRVTEVIGAWSMVDIYVVAVLVGLVNLGVLATIRSEIGMSFFGAVVVLTMLAAMSFDSRLIWDSAERKR